MENCCIPAGWEGREIKAKDLHRAIVLCCLSEVLGGRAELLAMLRLCFLERGCWGKGDVGMILVLGFSLRENWHSLRNKENLKLILKLFMLYLMPRKIFYT